MFADFHARDFHTCAGTNIATASCSSLYEGLSASYGVRGVCPGLLHRFLSFAVSFFDTGERGTTHSAGVRNI